MEWSVFGDIANSIGVLIIAIGLIVTIRANGTKQRERDLAIAKEQQIRDEERALRDQKLRLNQDAILQRLNDDKTGLTAINLGMADQEQRCTRISTHVGDRLDTAERDIDYLHDKEKKAK